MLSYFASFLCYNLSEVVSGYERACHLFRTRRYKVVSPSDYAIRIRTPNVQCCLFWPASRKNRNENKIKLCFWWISNVSERLGIVSTWDLRWDIFKLYLVRNCFLSLYLFPLSLWYDVNCSLQIRNTVWMGDFISRSTEFIGLLGNRTALEKILIQD